MFKLCGLQFLKKPVLDWKGSFTPLGRVFKLIEIQGRNLMENKIIHIYPPGSGGVSDYVDICIQHQEGAIKFPLNQELAPSTTLSGNVLLHLSGYGYAKRGAPLWLLKKLGAERANIKTLGVYFHELYAFGPPWRSAFWLSPVQRHISRRIAELADFWITNREDSAEWLRRFAADKPHAVLPVFSNVGEMATYSPKRLPQIVVFGGAALRAATYRAAGDLLFIWTKAQGLELHDIGPAMDDQALNDSLTQAGAKVHGRLVAEEASSILSEASFGLVKYPVEYVAKSSVFAAYATHGVCPILLSDCYVTSDGLVVGEHYLAGLPDECVNGTIVGGVGKAAWEWYQPHRIEVHVTTQLNFSQKASKRVN